MQVQNSKRIKKFLVVVSSAAAPHLTVVTMHTTVPSDVGAPGKDAHAASVVPNAMAAQQTTAVRVASSHGQ
jgi:hypothetical protein